MRSSEQTDVGERTGSEPAVPEIGKRAVIGFTLGIISSLALITTLHILGIALGAVVGVLYALPVRPIFRLRT